jgi:urease accessory protein
MQRSRGRASVALDLARGRVRLADLAQEGSAKVILPHSGQVPEAVFLNTSGGLTGGDRLSYSVQVGAGLRAVATTQTAERVYRAGTGRAEVTVSADVGAGGWLDWVPQETIVFDGAALDRRTVIRLSGDAGCLMSEAVVLGRAAMGEAVRRLHLTDRREIWRDGRLVAVEPLALTDAALMAGDAALGPARAFASLVMVGPGVADALGPVRAVLQSGAASAYDGRLVVRIMAADGWPLRQEIIRVLKVLRRGAPLPRVWQDFGEAA